MVSFNEKKGGKKKKEKRNAVVLSCDLLPRLGFRNDNNDINNDTKKQRQNPACRPISPALITRRSARQMKLQSGRSDAVLAVVSTD